MLICQGERVDWFELVVDWEYRNEDCKYRAAEATSIMSHLGFRGLGFKISLDGLVWWTDPGN